MDLIMPLSELAFPSWRKEKLAEKYFFDFMPLFISCAFQNSK